MNHLLFSGKLVKCRICFEKTGLDKTCEFPLEHYETEVNIHND